MKELDRQFLTVAKLTMARMVSEHQVCYQSEDCVFDALEEIVETLEFIIERETP